MLKMLPALPMLRIDPELPMLRIEPALPMDKIEPMLPMLMALPKLMMLHTLPKLKMLNRLLALRACFKTAWLVIGIATTTRIWPMGTRSRPVGARNPRGRSEGFEMRSKMRRRKASL